MDLKRFGKIVPFVFLWISFVLIGEGFAQNLPPGQYTSTNKKAIKYFEESRSLFNYKKDEEAEKKIQAALKEDPNFTEVYAAYADYLMYKNRIKEAIPNYKKAIEISPNFMVDNKFFLGKAYMALSDYDNAKLSLEAFIKHERINPTLKDEAQLLIKNCAYASTLVKNPKPFKPINAGPGINTAFNEYFPSINGDGKQFLFTREIEYKENPMARQEDFYMSKKENNVWQTALPIQSVNTPGNEGAPTLSADGNIMFFASCISQFGDYGAEDRKGYGSCDVFYAQKVNGKWSRARNAGSAINSTNWETQPSFSSDGKTLYFIKGVVDRAGNRKNIDIYMSVIGEDGKFQPAQRLSDVVNSKGNEESVFIHPDNMTLYFASDGHPGLGGTDLFMSKRQPNGEWGPPVNLGYPINTSGDENSLLVDPSGSIAYFASDRDGGFGGLDIYQFELPIDVRPEKITYTKGKIYNARTKEPLEANFELIDLESGKNITKAYSSANGEFLVTLTASKNYMVNVNKEGFLFYSDNFSLKDKVADFNKPYLLDIPLEPLDTGSVVELKNVFFDVNKWDLKPESKTELIKLAQFLTKYPNVRIELGGHTDNSGDKKFNILLSTNRAKAVMDFLIKDGKIEDSRLSYKGYADTRPKVPNDSPENKAKNRRTEFKIIGK
jgi:outer membrane protein OmpA-like peptidoglycan-associated protein/tetratricopeptide (TPR) repeat protein